MNKFEQDNSMVSRSSLSQQKDCERRSSTRLRFKSEIKLVNFESDTEVRVKRGTSFSDHESRSMSCEEYGDKTLCQNESLPFIVIENNDENGSVEDNDETNKGSYYFKKRKRINLI